MGSEQYFIDKQDGRYEVNITESTAGYHATIKGVTGGSPGGITNTYKTVQEVWEAVNTMLDANVDDTEEWVD